MRRTQGRSTVVGVIVLALILAGTFAALTVKGDILARAYPLSANFRDTAGLARGDLVTIAGVRIGHVGRIAPDGDSVRVTLAVNHGVEVASGSTAAVKVATLLGRKEVTLAAPAAADWHRVLRAGDHIGGLGTSPTEVLAVQSDAQAALATLDANALGAFLRDLGQVTADKAGQVGTIIDGLNRLTSTVDSRSTEVRSVIDAANAVTGTIEGRNRALLSAVDNLDLVVANLGTRRAEITRLLATTIDASSRIADVIGANRAKLDAVLTQLQTDLGVVNRHQVDLAQTVSYLAGAIQGFSSIGYSGSRNLPTQWASIFTVGLGPASGDPIFGCNGELDAILTLGVGADPVTDCRQYSGPIPGGAASGAPRQASGAAPSPSVAPPAPRRAAPGPVITPTARSTADSLDALLIPLLSAGPGGSQPVAGGGR